ncbi:MAG: hypothetical protein RL071_2571 [Pseudomonadota bacterium]
MGLGAWLSRSLPGAPAAATLAINLAGCAALGLLVGLGGPQLRPGLRLPLAVGFLGSFTTFSTFSLEAAQLWQGGRGPQALAYVGISVLGGLLAVTAGLGLGGLLRGAG